MAKSAHKNFKNIYHKLHQNLEIHTRDMVGNLYMVHTTFYSN